MIRAYLASNVRSGTAGSEAKVELRAPRLHLGLGWLQIANGGLKMLRPSVLPFGPGTNA